MRITRAHCFFGITAMLSMAMALPAAAQGAARAGPFDPRSGKFGGVISSEAARAPDTVAVSSDRVWSALSQVYSQLGIQLSVADTESHVIGALRVVQRRPVAGERLSRLLECGTGPYGANAERYTVQLTVLTSLQSIGDKLSTIDTRVAGTAAPNGLNSTVACASSGVLEEKVTELVRKALGQ